MPRRPRPLPPRLLAGPFVTSAAAALGVPAGWLHRTDLVALFHGVHAVDAPVELDARCRAALLAHSDRAFVCGATAAMLWGVPLPRRLQDPPTLHIALPRPERAPRGAGISGHSLGVNPSELRRVRGVTVTGPDRTWSDLARELALDELIIAGDHLARWDLGLASRASLTNEAKDATGRRGRSRMLLAAEEIEDRSQSAGETRLRLVLRRAGVTGLVLNHDVVSLGGPRYRVDLAIPELRVAIEYQGAYHADATVYRADRMRIERLRADGWLVIEVTARDLDDPVELVERIRRSIARHRSAA